MLSSGVLLLIPILISGFIFNTICYRTRVASASAEGQRLFFMAAASGTVCAVAAFCIQEQVLAPLDAKFEIRAVPFPHAGTMSVALLLAVLAATICNFASLISRYLFATKWRWSTWGWIYVDWVRSHGNPLQQLLFEASERDDALVLLSLKSRKVYCGAIHRLPPILAGAQEFVEIIPKFSATRDKDSLAFSYHLEYTAFEVWQLRQRLLEIQRKMKKVRSRLSPSKKREYLAEAGEIAERLSRSFASFNGEPADFHVEDWVKVIPVEEIETASVYDTRVSANWFNSPSLDPPDHAVSKSSHVPSIHAG